MLFTPALSSRALRIYTYRILSLKHRLYSATVQPSLTASDQGPGSLTRVPSRASPGRGVPHAQPCAPTEVMLFLLWAFAGPQNDHQLPFCTTELFSFVRPLHPPCPGVGDWLCSLILCICPRSLMHSMVLGFSSARSSALCPTVIPHWPRATQSETALTCPPLLNAQSHGSWHPPCHLAEFIFPAFVLYQ